MNQAMQDNASEDFENRFSQALNYIKRNNLSLDLFCYGIPFAMTRESWWGLDVAHAIVGLVKDSYEVERERSLKAEGDDYIVCDFENNAAHAHAYVEDQLAAHAHEVVQLLTCT